MYNYFGFTDFVDLFPTFQVLGLFSSGFHSSAFKDVFNHGMNSGVVEHSNIMKLAKHSPFLDFIVNILGISIDEFIKHKDSFTGCILKASETPISDRSLYLGFHVPMTSVQGGIQRMTFR